MDLEQELQGRSILVTGGAGFVGANIVARLCNMGAKVTVLDNLETGRLENLAGAGEFRMVEGSVCDSSLVEKLIAETELVIHAAARNIIVSTRNPRDDFDVNIGGTLNVLMAARVAKVKRVVYTSSASIYGNPAHLPVMEDDRPSLLSPYAVSKFAGESYCSAFYESYGVPVSIVRYSNVYGTLQSPSNPYCGVVAKFFTAVMNDSPIDIHGDGQQTRDFTFVDDAVEATLMAAVSPRADGEAFNIGTGFEHDVNSLAEKIMQVAGKRVEVRHIDRRDIDNIRRRVVSIEKIRRMLHWVPAFTLLKGLEKTKRWMESTNSVPTSQT